MRRRLEMNVAESTSAAPSDDRLLVGRGEISQELAALVVPDDRAGRNVDDQRPTLFSVPLLAPSRSSGFCLESARKLELQQAREIGLGSQNDIATATAIAAVRTAPRHIFFAP